MSYDNRNAMLENIMLYLFCFACRFTDLNEVIFIFQTAKNAPNAEREPI